MKFNRIHAILSSAMVFTAINAQAMQISMPDWSTWSYKPLVTLSLGGDHIRKNDSQTLSVFPPVDNTYTNSDSSQNVVDGGVFVGFEHVINDYLWAQIGLSAYISGEFTPKGHVWLFGSPDFDTYTYRYNVNHERLMVEGKFLTTLTYCQPFHPYISWGVGVAFNRADQYLEFPINSGVAVQQGFTSHNQTPLAWELGIGADYIFNQHARLGIGYQFMDLGSVALDGVPGAPTTQALNLQHLYTDQLRIQFTYVM